MLFSYFNAIDYNSNKITDIFRNYNSYFLKAAKNFTIKNYTIQGSPRPETLAYQLYGNTDLYWVLLMLNNNNTIDPFMGWIKTETACYEIAEQQYKENKVLYHMNQQKEIFYNLVEYPLDTNLWYDKGDTTFQYLQYDKPLKAVDIYEDAIIQNEKLRTIKIIDPRDINSFISNFIRELETA